MSADANTYRDGRVYVCKQMCATCIFRPGNLMRLRSGALRGVVDDAVSRDTAIICHSSLSGFGGGLNAVCRGFFDRYPTQPLQVAQRLDLIEWVTL